MELRDQPNALIITQGNINKDVRSKPAKIKIPLRFLECHTINLVNFIQINLRNLSSCMVNRLKNLIIHH